MENAASIFRDRAVYTLLAVESECAPTEALFLYWSLALLHIVTEKNDVVTYVPLVDDAGKDLLGKHSYQY